MPYDPAFVQPFRDELTRIGFRELRTPREVDEAVLKQKGMNLLVINSVCGCAAGKARPGIAAALEESPVQPDLLTTVFAGADLEATSRARELIGPIPPSSPSIALFRDGALVHFVPRSQIEGEDARQIARRLVALFAEHGVPSASG